MRRISSFAFSLFMILALMGSIIIPGLAQAPDQPDGLGPDKQLREVPADVQAMFKGGMTVDRFLALNKGPVPHALQQYSNTNVAVILEMEGSPLAELYSEQLKSGKAALSSVSQQNYVQSLEQAQKPAIAALKQMGGQVIASYTKVYNGILVSLPVSQLSSAAKLSGVKAVHAAPVDRLSLSKSVPLIRAPEVWSSFSARGDGVTIAVIDTGIDYTHAALGGSGNSADYASNNPNIVEPGTFPTAKVVGGYDFAGTDYDASSTAHAIPVPDDDPLDEHGHGTHVSSTAAGIGVSGKIGEGVAPMAKLLAVKVFGASGSTNLVLSGIEFAMDPNGDGIIDDHADVINMSLGSDFGPNDPTDPEIIASNYASAVGVVVVAASGNAGNQSYITSSPAAANAAISVAASTTGFATGPTVTVSGTTYITQTNIIYQPGEFDNGTGHFTQGITASLLDVGTVITDTLCTTGSLAANAFQGKVALIQRGTCAFSVKVNNAASLGAVAAMIYNSASGGNSRTTMVGTLVNIPAGFIAHTDGVNLAVASGQTVVISAEDNVSVVPDIYTPADTIADFSSRGPRGFDSYLKPEIAAPGVGIFAAAMGTGTNGISMNGTSMATPHIAGVAALLREVHPSWSVEQIKAAMMNTAVDLNSTAAFSVTVPGQGAGRVDAYSAARADTLAIGDSQLVSLNWGVPLITSDTYSSAKDITLENLANITKTYDVSWSFFTQSSTDGVNLTVPISVTVPPNSSIKVPVKLDIDATKLESELNNLEEYYGYIVFTPSVSTSNSIPVNTTLRVPFYLSPRPYDVLAVDAPAGLGASGTVTLTHTGPISSSLEVFPLLSNDKNDLNVGDEADLRYVGMDYSFSSSKYGDVVEAAFNTWGAWHDPQPYFAEFDLYLYVNKGQDPDLVDFNYNLGWLNGGDDTNDWIVVQVDLATGTVDLGSPYLVSTDFNSGLMGFYLPASDNGLTSTNTDFAFQLIGFDYNGNADITNLTEFDYLHPPLSIAISGDPGPADPVATLHYTVADPGSFDRSRTLGLMVVDSNGKPGSGQAYSVSIKDPTPTIFLPLVNK
jgi:minor extracellular serine protease Vpr